MCSFAAWMMFDQLSLYSSYILALIVSEGRRKTGYLVLAPRPVGQSIPCSFPYYCKNSIAQTFCAPSFSSRESLLLTSYFTSIGDVTTSNKCAARVDELIWVIAKNVSRQRRTPHIAYNDVQLDLYSFCRRACLRSWSVSRLPWISMLFIPGDSVRLRSMHRTASIVCHQPSLRSCKKCFQHLEQTSIKISDRCDDSNVPWNEFVQGL